MQRFSGVLGAISPDWSLAALTRREEGQGVTLVLSELASGKEIHTLQAPGDIYGVTFSPEGQRVAANMYNVFQDLFSFWSVDSGQLDRTLYDWVGFSYSPDGRFIAALLETGSGSEKGELNIFDATTFKWIKTLAKDADALWYAYPAFSPDGQVLAASFGNDVILWDTQTWKELASLPASSPTGFAFSPDGRIFDHLHPIGHGPVMGGGGSRVGAKHPQTEKSRSRRIAEASPQFLAHTIADLTLSGCCFETCSLGQAATTCPFPYTTNCPLAAVPRKPLSGSPGAGTAFVLEGDCLAPENPPASVYSPPAMLPASG